MRSVEKWAERTFEGVRFDSFGSYHGQVRFEVPALVGEGEKASSLSTLATSGDKLTSGSVESDEEIARRYPETQQGRRRGIRALFETLESNKGDVGLEFYSVGATTLDQVFLNVVRENNVKEEGYAAVERKRGRGWRCW